MTQKLTAEMPKKDKPAHYTPPTPESVKGLRELPRVIAFSELYSPVMWMTDKRSAARYFALLTARRRKHFSHTSGTAITQEDADRIEKHNISYYKKFYYPKLGARVVSIFKCPKISPDSPDKTTVPNVDTFSVIPA